MKFSEIALKNSRPINVIRIVFAILGIYVLFSLPREQYPNVPLYYVHILVPYPGASAEEIEQEITQNIEKKTKELSNITSVTSLISDGLSFTRIAYNQKLSEKEFKNNYLELQALITNISLPEKALNPIVDNFTYLDFIPIIDVIVYSESEDIPIETLVAQSNRVKTKLELVSAINRIETAGLYKRKILINLDKEKMEENFLSLYEVSQAIQNNNVDIPAGILETQDISIKVKVGKNIKTIDDIGNILIRSFPDDLYLKDIASIDFYYDQNKEQIRFNGTPSTTLKIFKSEDKDSIELVKEIDGEIAKLKKSMPEGINIATFADTTKGVKNSISILTSNAILGFILLCISLFIFLGWKPALISALEIPFTFATSFFILKLLGITLNTSTLFALVLVLGMIVDHSIVILENIIRLRHFHQKDRRTSVIDGVSEIGFPVISSTLTTIGTFLPLAFMPGLIGKFLLPVPVTITVTLIVSTISALIIIPIHYIEMPGNERTHELKIFEWGRKRLKVILTILLKHPIFICIISLAVAFLAIFSLFNLPVSLYDTEDQPFFYVDVVLPVGSSIQKSDQVMKKMEEVILPLKEKGTILSVITAIGNTQIDPAEGIRFDQPYNAQLQIEIPFEKQGELNEILLIVEEKINSMEEIDIPFTIKMRKQRTGPPTSSALGFRVLGDNSEELKDSVDRIEMLLLKYDELSNIRTNLIANKTEINIHVNEKDAQQYGHSTASISGLTRQWLSDDAVSDIFVNNAQNDILVKLSNISQTDKEELNFITFPSRNSQEIIVLKDVASISRETVLNKIYREEGKRVATITADSFSRERIKEINSKVIQLFDNEIAIDYPNLIFQLGGEFDEFSSLLNDILILLLIGVFVVYVILVSEFKSYSQPLLIMLTILFTTIGVSFYLQITQSSLSITVLYSFVALVGVVVNGAIVLVSTANSIYRSSAITHKEAIILATQQRLKPILLTSITTIIGVLPTALGLNGKSPIWQPMASTIAVGLAVSTVTTLIIIPSFYALLPNKKTHEDII